MLGSHVCGERCAPVVPRMLLLAMACYTISRMCAFVCAQDCATRRGLGLMSSSPSSIFAIRKGQGRGKEGMIGHAKIHTACSVSCTGIIHRFHRLCTTVCHAVVNHPARNILPR